MHRTITRADPPLWGNKRHGIVHAGTAVYDRGFGIKGNNAHALESATASRYEHKDCALKGIRRVVIRGIVQKEKLHACASAKNDPTFIVKRCFHRFYPLQLDSTGFERTKVLTEFWRTFLSVPRGCCERCVLFTWRRVKQPVGTKGRDDLRPFNEMLPHGSLSFPCEKWAKNQGFVRCQ